MQISLQQASKRFNKEWIFRNLDYTFEAGQHYALIGNNGSGKSTLLQIIAGYSSLTKGKIDWSENDHSTIFKQLSFAAPYLELIEEFTLEEQINFHFQFKKLLTGTNKETLLETLGLKGAQHKAIKYFSSGMKQRVKLALAVFSDTSLLLLDEPTANLDEQGIAWYRSLISQYGVNRTLVVCSNQQHEYDYCRHHIQLADYKKF
jgi:ABC-type multidrug transport system ATPase subunit